MRLLRSARWMVLAILVSIFVPATSHAGVFISVAIAPPSLPVYDQPPCPEPGLIWTPGYWAYDYDSGGYYWVPGTWVPAPYVGALWTPGYWGWEEGVYLWHPGYWGRHVGYYGGVNYGFGYFGVGFVGGMWRGNAFAYNTAVWHVDRERIHDVYEDRRDFDRYTIRNDRHLAFSGGPGGIRHDPTPDERNFMREEHMQPTSFQQQHIEAAQHDRNAFFNNNHGRPAVIAAERPLTPRGGDMRPGMDNNRGRQNGGQDNRGVNPQYQNNNRPDQNNNRPERNNNRPDQNNNGPSNAAPYPPNQGGTRPGYNTPQQPNEPQGTRPGYNNPAQQNPPSNNQPYQGGRYENRGQQNQPNRQPNDQPYQGGRQNENRGPQNQPNRQPNDQPYQGGRQNENRGQQNQPNNNGPAPYVRNSQPERRPPQQVQPQPAPQAPPQQQMRPQPQPQQPRENPQQMRPQPEIRQAPPQQRQDSRPAPQQQQERGNDRERGHGRDR